MKKKFKKISFFFLAFLVNLIWLIPNFFIFNPAQATTKNNYKAGEVLIKFKNSSDVLKIKIDYNVSLDSVIKFYDGNENVEFIEPNYFYQMADFPNDPDLLKQSYLQAINVRQAWSKELLIREQEKIVRRSIIAVLDTGVDLDHPDLKEKIWRNIKERPGDGIDNDRNGYIDDVNGWDFVDSDADPNPSIKDDYSLDAVSHGTIVSGVAAAVTNNNQGISGVSWFSEIMPLRVLDSQGSGDVYSAVQAINYAVNNGGDVINMSFIGTSDSQSLETAIRNAYNKGVIVVAAGGNTDPSIDGVDLNSVKYYPVCSDGSANENMVVGVASVDASLKKSKFSNYGSCIDVVAPGQNFYATEFYQADNPVFSTLYGGYWSGTSLSTPLVSGAFGIIKALRPNYSLALIKEFVFQGAKNIDYLNPEYKGKLGYGQLDVGNALELMVGKKLVTEQPVKNNYIVVGLGFGSFPQIKVVKQDGTMFKEFYAYNPSFKGAINVAVGDINGDGEQEIITGAGAGGGPHVRVFNIDGIVLNQFFAYENNFRGGVNIASGDLNGDGKNEIVTGPGKGYAPRVKIFDTQGNMIGEFLAYDKGFIGGVKVAVGDINGDGRGEIITGAGAGGGPHVRVFDSNGILVNQFFAFNKNFNGGINVASGDIHGDGTDEIIVSVEAGSLPTVRVFYPEGRQISNFLAFEPNFIKGVYVSVGDIDQDGVGDILVSRAVGGAPDIRIYNHEGKLKSTLNAYNLDYSGGARTSVITY